MRKRERWLNLPWIAWMEGDTAEGRTCPPQDTFDSLWRVLTNLTHNFRRYVEFEAFGDGYDLKVLPANPKLEPVNLAIGLSYSGMSLERMLRQAELDLGLLDSGNCKYRVVARGYTRWVP